MEDDSLILTTFTVVPWRAESSVDPQLRRMGPGQNDCPLTLRRLHGTPGISPTGIVRPESPVLSI